MKWIDYRKKLEIGFNDQQKLNYFYVKIFNILDDFSDETMSQIDEREYFLFCDMTGTIMEQSVYHGEQYKLIIQELHKHCQSLEEFLSYYIAFVNCQQDSEYKPLKKNQFINILCNLLEDAHIQYDIMEDSDGYFLFPKGVKEFDYALVTEVLEWLSDYPGAQKTYVAALKQYADGIYIRDVADNLRKALETFLQEFLGNKKNLESNKNEICRYLSSHGVDSGISGLYQPLISAYKNINDRIAKHNDKVDAKLLEFLLYQTGILIRMPIVIKLMDI